MSFSDGYGCATWEGGHYLQRFSVSFEYPVFFTTDLFGCDNPVLPQVMERAGGPSPYRYMAVVDEGVAQRRPQLAQCIEAQAARHAGRLELAAPPVIVPGGEAVKHDPAVVADIQAMIQRLGIDRHSYVVAIGGGALLDAVGFAAATAHRGLRLIRVPTTVLAQADSGVGVKNGVNAFGTKNFVGTFAPPFAVINDFAFLSTLDRRDRIAGMAEAVKVALIRDARFFRWLEDWAEHLAAFETGAVGRLVSRCAELHMRHIAEGGDPFETGSARPLDFGHWSAHKLETLTGHALRHGEAVAIGVALDSRYSVEVGLLAAGAEERVAALLERLGFRLWHPALDLADAAGRRLVLDGLKDFREHLGGELTVTLLAGIGDGVEVHAIDEAAVLRAIAWLQARERRS